MLAVHIWEGHFSSCFVYLVCVCTCVCRAGGLVVFLYYVYILAKFLRSIQLPISSVDVIPVLRLFNVHLNKYIGCVVVFDNHLLSFHLLCNGFFV